MSDASGKIYDISRTVGPSIAVWPGDTPFSSEWTLSRKEGYSCDVSRIRMSTHTGTHADAPFHYAEEGATIDQVPLDPYIGPATVAEVNATPAVRPEDLGVAGSRSIERLLIRTGSCSDDTVYNEDFTYLSDELAEWCVQRGLKLIGTDAPSVDRFTSKTLTVHRTLLKGRVAILEGLDLTAVPAGDYELVALPLKLAGIDASPVRAILRAWK